MTDRIEVAAAVIERADGTFLMTRRPAGKAYAGWWEFPGGKVEPGETARHALARELEEELGIRVCTAYPWLCRDHDYAHARVRLNFFRVVDWAGEPRPHEGQGLAWVRAERPQVGPILPANGPILKGLTLPLVYAISAATELGTARFLARLDAALEAGLGLLQLREKSMPPAALAALARLVSERCQAYGARLLINGDLALAARIGVGVHLTAAQLKQLVHRPALPWVGASCHDAAELEMAQALGVDFVVLGPVKPTPTHPGAKGLGWTRLAELIAGCAIPVYALGGLCHADLATARQAGAHGIAMKTGVWS